MGQREIALLPASNELAQANFEMTVDQSSLAVDLRDHSDLLSSDDQALMEVLYNEHGTLSIWGGVAGNESFWRQLKRGDVAFFYKSGKLSAWAVTLTKLDNPALADRLWELDDRGEQWRFIYVLTPAQPLDVEFIPWARWAGYTMDYPQRTRFVRKGEPNEHLRFLLPKVDARPLMASALLPSGQLTAREALAARIGDAVATVTSGAVNRIKDVQGGTAVVATAKSPEGTPVPITKVQEALEALVWEGSVEIAPEAVGYRSSFIGAWLASLDEVEVVPGSPPILRLSGAGGRQGEDWSIREVAVVVSEYFAMLRAELNGDSYTKAEHWKRTVAALAGRTKGAVEYKFGNISAVLEEQGLPRVQGYQPYGHSQELLEEVVAELLDADIQLLELMTVPVDASAPASKPEPSLAHIFTEPPQPTEAAKSVGGGNAAPGVLGGSEVDLSELGREGEEFVLSVERQRLSDLGRSDLADKIEHVAITKGDGLGYDVLSFEEDGTLRYIEVKTTTGGPNKAFFVSPNELKVSQKLGEPYYLYRVYSFRKSPRIWVVNGQLDDALNLQVSTYRAFR